MNLFDQQARNAAKQQAQAQKEEVAAYRRLETLSVQNEFKEYSDRLIKTVAEKMIFAFTGDAIKNWDDFCKVRGEVHARLQPLQEVHEAGAIARTLEEKLKEFYAQTNLSE